MFTSAHAYDVRSSAVDFEPHHHVGEAVLVVPCKRQADGRVAALEEESFAGHAAFAWRPAMVARPSRGAGTLRYRSYRQTATFARVSLPFMPRIGDRLTRFYDGIRFEVIEVRIEGAHVTCDVTEITPVQ